MPLYARRNIFDAIADRPTLGIIFGRLGFNEMRETWKTFAPTIPTLSRIADPFTDELRPIDIGNQRWLWFIHAGPGGGMGDTEFIQSLDSAFVWATANGIRYVITNGISDVGHGTNTELNRLNDDRRTRLLVAYAVSKERQTGIGVELTSLNDVFTRNGYLA